MRRLWRAALALLLAGCAVAPMQRLPPTVGASPATQAAFLHGGDTGLSVTALPPHWWRLYQDARLDAYLEEAFAANTDLRAAEANLARAGFAIAEAQAGSAASTGISAQAQFENSWGGAAHGASHMQYSLGAAVSYPLDVSGAIARAIDAAKAGAQASEALRDNLRVTIAAAVTRNYVGVCSSNRALAAAQRVLTVEQQTYAAIGRLFDGGRATRFDLSRAQAAVDQNAAAIPPLRAQRQAQLYALAALMGRPTAQYPVELQDCATPPALSHALPVGDGAALISRRPDIRAAQRSLQQASALIDVEAGQLYPQVSLGASLAGAGRPVMWSGALGPLLSWTWPNRQAVRARIAQAGAGADAAAAQFDGAVIEALRQTETALDRYARGIEQLRQLQAARDSASGAAQQAQRLFQFGRIAVIDLLSAQATLANAEASLASAQAALGDQQINVFLALGGGWER